MPEGLWVKCEACKEIVYSKDLDRNAGVCPKCDFHFRIDAPTRIRLLLDEEPPAISTRAFCLPTRSASSTASPTATACARTATGWASTRQRWWWKVRSKAAGSCWR